MKEAELLRLELTAYRCRRNILRMIEAGHHGHFGGSFSSIDIATALYFYKMNIDPANPKMEHRDRFLLSAGHKCMTQYAVLAERGYFDNAVLDTYGSLGTKLPGHPDMYKLPGVEANTGALGHGLSIATGMALGLRGTGAKVYAIMGDGELAEGSNWEAAAAAAHHKVDNVTAFLDNNGLQISGRVTDVMSMEPIAEKFRAFGWAVREIDGNDMRQIVDALDSLPFEAGKPSMVVAHTVKGKGVSFLEDTAACHFWTPKGDELERAKAEIEAKISALETAVKEAE